MNHRLWQGMTLNGQDDGERMLDYMLQPTKV